MHEFLSSVKGEARMSNKFLANGLVLAVALFCTASAYAMETRICSNEMLSGEVIEGNVVVEPGTSCDLNGFGGLYIKGNVTADGAADSLIVRGPLQIDGNLSITDSQPGTEILLVFGPRIQGNVTVSDNDIGNENALLLFGDTFEGALPPISIGGALTMENNRAALVVVGAPPGIAINVTKQVTVRNNEAVISGIANAPMVLNNVVAPGLTYTGNRGLFVTLFGNSVTGNVTFNGNESFVPGEVPSLINNFIGRNLSCSGNSGAPNLINNTVQKNTDCSD